MRLWPFRPSQSEAAAEALLACVAQASRRPGFFGPGRLADTLDGRFELLTLHAILALRRLSQAPEEARLGQLFTDKLFRYLDAGLREAGVGDLSVPKGMQRMAGAFYGRLGVYDRALQEGRTALEAALTRNALAGAPDFATALAGYVELAAAKLEALAVAALFQGDSWPPTPE
ncbi:MAG: ubiquinol-cytochrome C chaperone family protein [Terricaulis sp.]